MRFQAVGQQNCVQLAQPPAGEGGFVFLHVDDDVRDVEAVQVANLKAKFETGFSLDRCRG
jgi:hypothetical protein